MLEYNGLFEDFLFKKARYKIAYGGRGGGKSTNIAIGLLVRGAAEKLLIVCLREYQKNLNESVYRLLSNLIFKDKALSAFYIIFSHKIVGKNGTEFHFSGIKKAMNFQSFEGADIAWIEEAQMISNDSVRIVLPTIRKYGSEIWFSYNPNSETDPVHKMMLNSIKMNTEELKAGGYDVSQINLQINYLNNPHCSFILQKEAEILKENDYNLYKHIWLGETLKMSDSLIYKDKFELLNFEVEYKMGIALFENEVVHFNYGLDFGWGHPTAIIESFKYDGCIYVYNEIVGREMDLDNITLEILDKMPNACYNKIYADSARPDLIHQLNQPRLAKDGGKLPSLEVVGANKGAGSVESGITYLKTHKKIYVHPRCINTLDNFRKYSYKNDKNGNISTEILKLNDDALDALRYSYSGLMNDEHKSTVDWEDEEFLNQYDVIDDFY